MIIGIDISSIPYGTGVSNYTQNLVKHLLPLDSKNQYKLFFSSLRLKLPSDILKLPLKYKNISIYQFKIPPTLLSILWNKLHLIPIEWFIGSCNIFHTSDWTQPSTRCPNLSTIHDLTPFLFPKWIDPKIIAAHQSKMFWAIKKASHFICVSQNTQSDLLKLFPDIPKDKTSVIYEAAEDKYSDFRHLKKNHQQQLINSIKTKYNLGDYLLAQGTREPRKNLDRLIQAFLLFKKKHPKSKLELAISGKYGWGQDIKPHPQIRILGYIQENDMVQLHAAATALIYPSLYEGFGLPIIKAMAVGTPVITSRNSSLTEIGKDASILVDPKSISSICSAIETVGHHQTRLALIKRGIVRSKEFSWETTAKSTLKIYQKFSC